MVSGANLLHLVRMTIEIPVWLASEFHIRQQAEAGAIVRHDFAALFDALGLIRSASPDWQPPPDHARCRPLPGGRAPARVISAGPLGDAVIRRYRRGGLVRRLNPARYFLHNRAFDELVLTERLRRLRVPVPEALAAVQCGSGRGYTACLITRRILGAQTVATLLRGIRPGAAGRLLEEVGKSVRRLHEAGCWHADLNANNLLATPGRTGIPVILIDFDRGRLRAGPLSGRLARRNLRRLHHSFDRLGLAEAVHAWSAFERGYLSTPGPTPAA